jgi:hypothetical protein
MLADPGMKARFTEVGVEPLMGSPTADREYRALASGHGGESGGPREVAHVIVLQTAV